MNTIEYTLPEAPKAEETGKENPFKEALLKADFYACEKVWDGKGGEATKKTTDIDTKDLWALTYYR